MGMYCAEPSSLPCLPMFEDLTGIFSFIESVFT